MTVCPIALAVGCVKCPALNVCPLKSVLGNFEEPEEEGPGAAKPEAEKKTP